MTKTVFRGMETAQNQMGRSGRIRINSTSRPSESALLYHRRPFGQAIVAEPLWIPSERWTTIAENQPVVVEGRSIWEISYSTLEVLC